MSSDEKSSSDPQSFVNQDEINERLQTLLIESTSREKVLRRQLNEQKLRNDQLQLKLDMMEQKSCCKLETSSDESEKSEKVAAQPIEEDLKETFGTNSTALMQYRYDELRQSYSRAVRKLTRKSKNLAKVLSEVELEKFKNEQLTREVAELNKKIEQVCFRYFDLMDRRSDERRLFDTKTEQLRRDIRLLKFELEMKFFSK